MAEDKRAGSPLRELEGLEGAISQIREVLEEWVNGEGSFWQEDKDMFDFVSSLTEVSTSIPNVRRRIVKVRRGKEKRVRYKGPPPTPTPCPICLKELAGKQGMREHMLRVHKGILPPGEIQGHLCSLCGDRFQRYSSLDRHKITVHWNKEPGMGFRCHLCRVPKKGEERTVYEDKETLNAHMVQEHGGVCEECGQRFPVKAALEIHIKRGHLVHKRKRTRKKTEPEVMDSSSSSSSSLPTTTTPHPHPCDLCSRWFGKKNNLITHFRDVHQIPGVEKM